MKTKVSKKALAKAPAAAPIEGTKKDVILFLNASANYIKSEGKNGIVAVYIEDWNQRNKLVFENITNQQADITKEQLTIPTRKARAKNAALDEKGHVVFDEKGEPKFTPDGLVKLADELDEISAQYNKKIQEFNAEPIKYVPVLMPKVDIPKNLSEDYRALFEGFIL